MTPYTTISADSHVVEPPNLWVDYIAPEFRPRAPHVERRGDSDVFVCEELTFPAISLLAAAGKPSETLSPVGTYERDCPRGAWDPHARLKEMAVDGVEAEVLYPSIALKMYSITDLRLQAACFQAYNTWMADFCKAYPDRFKGLALIALEDIEAAITELHRCRDLGLSGASITILPDQRTPYDSPAYEPFWAAAEGLGMPVSLHIGTTRASPATSGNVGYLVGRSIDHYMVEQSLATLIFSGVFHRHPSLKAVSAENDIGWAAYFVERMDYMFSRRKTFGQLPIPRTVLPSEYFHRNVFLTFMRDRPGMLVRSITGVPNILWASDYPHTDSTWPDSQQVLDAMMADVPAEEQRMIRAENAAKLYGFPL